MAKPGQLLHLTAARHLEPVADTLEVDHPVSGAEAQERPLVAVDQHHRLDDLAQLAAHRRRGLDRGAGRLGQLLDRDVEPRLRRSLLEPQRSRVHLGQRWVPRWATRVLTISAPHRGQG